MKVNFRSFLSNFINLNFINVIGMLVPIITIPLLSRAFNSEVLSEFFLLNTVLQFGFIVTDYSFNFVGTRTLAKQSYDFESRSTLYFDIQITRLLLLLVYSVSASVILSEFFNYDVLLTLSFLLIGLLGHCLMSVWFFQGVSDLKFVTLANIVSRFFYLVLIVFFVKENSDIDIALLSNVIPILISGFIAFLYGSKKYALKKCSKGSILKKIYFQLCSGLNVFIGDFAPNLYNNIPTMVIGVLAKGDLFVAYTVTNRIVNAFISIQSVVSRALYPQLVKLSHMKSDNKSTLEISLIFNLFISLPSFLSVIFFGDIFINFLVGNKYPDAIEFLNVTSFGIIFVSLANSFGQGYFLPCGKDKVFRDVSVFVSIISSIVGIWLLYNYDVWGAVFLLLFARVMFVLTYSFAYFRD